MRALAALPLLFILFVSGCAMGPDYERPETNVPAEFRGEVTAEEAASYADLAWWEAFEDEVLQQLIREALNANYDLAGAIQRVEQARSGVGVARSGFYTGITYEGNVSRQRTPEEFGASDRTFNTFFGGIALAWELDVWGRIRRISESAENRYLSTEQARRGVMLTVATTVAQSYLTLLELDRELEIAEETADTFQKTLDLFQQRYEGGVGNRLATSRAEAALADTLAVIPSVELRITIQENAISVLLGRLPGPIPRGIPLIEEPLSPDVPVGLPSQLLERRPDIQEAEFRLAGTNALIGAAKASFFPQIGLTSFYGGQSEDLDNIAKGRFNIWNVVGNVTGPVFQGFKLWERYKGTKALFGEAAASYQDTVVRAFAEVSDVLSTREKIVEIRAARERSVKAYQTSVDLSLLRYQEGLSDYYEVMDALQQLFPAELDLAQAQLEQLLTIVDIYRVLGGGWEIDDDDWVAGEFLPNESDETNEIAEPSKTIEQEEL